MWCIFIGSIVLLFCGNCFFFAVLFAADQLTHPLYFIFLLTLFSGEDESFFHPGQAEIIYVPSDSKFKLGKTLTTETELM